jgi:hypothetical protein
MIMSQEKMDKHYDTFVKCVFRDGKFNDANLKWAFEHVTADMLREVQNQCMKIAFDAANNIANSEVK